MNTCLRHLLAAMLIGFSFSSAHAAGLLTAAGADTPKLEIKQHHVNVTIEDGYAITAVEQRFYNPNSADLEALYTFPVPEKASVGAFSYWIDGKEIQGEVLEKQQAKKIYEQEKAQGRNTALTEQDDYRRFESRVYPVRAQQEVRIKLVYYQAAHVDSAVGRYVYPLEEGGVDTEQMSFWHNDDTVREAFSFNVDLRSSYPIAGIRLPQHPSAIINQSSEQEWQITLGNQTNNEEEEATPQQTAAFHLNKDIVLYWKHKQGLPGAIDMVTYREPGESKGTFMLTLTPGADLQAIQQGRDWVFVIDISGSMKGKYQTLIEGVKRGLNKLNPNDRFRFVLFNNKAHTINKHYKYATPENVAHVISKLEQTVTSGGTNLFAGLENGLKSLDSDRASAIVLVTDGVANVGKTEKKQFLTLLENYDVRLFTFILGNSANRPLLDGMANISNGFAQSISNSDDIEGQILLAANKLNHSALHDIQLNIRGVKTKELTPTRISSLYAGQQLIVFGHYWGDGEAQIDINAKISGEEKQYTSRLHFPESNTRNPELERLWAYASIEQMQAQMDYLGEDADTRQAIVDVALEYGLVTNYTSMLVVQEEVFQEHNITRANEQRVTKEKNAKTQRSQAPVQSHRQDAQQPAFTGQRSYPSSNGGGGGGASGPWVIGLLLVLAMLRRRMK